MKRVLIRRTVLITRYKRPKSKSSSTTTSHPKKRARVSGSRTRLSKLHVISLFEDDFNEVFTGSMVSAGTQRSTSEELWVDKYKAPSLEELAVHKKKVDEVKAWFDERLKPSKDDVFRNNVLVISGQAGVGKSEHNTCLSWMSLKLLLREYGNMD